MSIMPFNIGVLAANNAIRGIGSTNTSGAWGAMQQSLQRLIDQTSKLGNGSTGPSAPSTSVNGADSGPVAQVSVTSDKTTVPVSLQGRVIQAAKSASLTVIGGTGGTLTSSGQYQLTGNAGTITLNLSRGQSLNDVAAQINQQTKATDVAATVRGNNLVLTSTLAGSTSSVQFKRLGPASTTVSGQMPTQISSFQVASQASNVSSTVTGFVTSSASSANLVYHGATGGTVMGTASFQLTGSLGSAQISMTQGENLSSVASRINQAADTTGVVATLNGNDLNLVSSTTGVNAIVQVSAINAAQQVTTSPVNSTQVNGVSVSSINSNTTEQLTGQVNQAAKQAQVALQGSSQGTIVDSATFQLTGSLGSSSFSVTQGQALSDVAASINQSTSSTGVVASVVSNSLVFQSTDVGSAASVAVQLTNITHTNVTSGVNATQLSSFQTDSLAAGATDTLSGTVNQTATQAQVTLQGSAQGTIVDTATFQLSGSLGSSNISVTQGQSLSSVATQINALSSSTGVVASVVSNNLVFKSSDVGSAANVGVQLTNITHTNVSSGVNASQVSSFQINSLQTGASETLSGTVSQTATQAALTLQGSSQGKIIDTATFTLSGAIGSSSISVTQGQTLSSVATQINSLTASTGVVASVVSNNLVFKSSGVGSSSNVGVQLTNITYSNTATGVNASQLSSFQINSLQNGASETLSGTVTKTATAAQLSFTGSLGFVNKNTTFTLQGALGSVQISTTKLETLSTLANQVNASSATTGVQAVLSGGDINFVSTGVGTNATVSITSTSGKFNVNGGDGSGNSSSAGTNAVATINGNTITGNGNSFQYSDALGSYSFTTVAGYTGSISPVNVKSQAGQFSITGGNGNGTANGTDAVATINGRTITGTGNAFLFTDSIGSYSFSTVAGFTGSLSPITVNSQAGQFNLSGGHGNGTANGTDAVATINGQTITGSGNSFHYSDSLGSYSFKTVAGYTGTLSPVTVTSQAGQFNLTGGHGNGTANGTDVVATINGQSVTGQGNTVQFSDGNGQFAIDFVGGYQGVFSPISIQSKAVDFDLQGGDAQGIAHGTNLVANIGGVAVSSATNQVSVTAPGGTYRIKFVDGFTGQFNPITVTSNSGVTITGGDQNHVAHGTDAVAMINGTRQTAAGTSFAISDNGVKATLEVKTGFEGNLNPIVLNQPTTADNTTTPTSSAADRAVTVASIKIIQDQINQGLILDQLQSVQNLNQTDTSAGSSSTQQSTTNNPSDTTTVKPAAKRNSSSNSGHSTQQWNVSSPQSSGKKVSVLS